MPVGQKVMFLGGSLMPFCRFRRELIARLVTEGVRVTCVYWGDRAEGFFRPFHMRGVSWHDLGGDHASPPGTADLVPMARLFRLIRHEAPDTICCFNAKPIVLGPLIARLARPRSRPRIVALMEGLGSALAFLLDEAGPKRRLFRVLTRPVGRWILLNDRDAGLIAALHPGSDIHVLPGIGIDPDHFRPGPDPLSERRLVFVGRLVEEKGIDTYLALARHLKDSAWRFAVAGLPTPRGIPASEIETWLETGLLESCGPVRDMADFYRRASVLIFPSRYHEGLPAVIMEAQASGLPCLIRDTPALGGTIREGETGFFVSGSAPEDWAAALARLQNPEVFAAFSAAARAHAQERFDQHAINARLAKLLIGSEPSRPAETCSCRGL